MSGNLSGVEIIGRVIDVQRLDSVETRQHRRTEDDKGTRGQGDKGRKKTIFHIEIHLVILSSCHLVIVGGKRSCNADTVHGRCRLARHASTAACAADNVVMQVTPLATAAERILPSSVRAPLPLGVLTIRAISLFFM